MCAPILLLLALLPPALLAQGSAMWTRMYSEAGQAGQQFYTEDYLPQLALLGYDNSASSVCAAGVWMYYEHDNYDGGNYGTQAAVLASDGQCFDLPADLAGQVSSVRQAGSPTNASRNTLTLYAFTNFRGPEFYMTRDWPDLGPFNDQAYSAIITGDLPWTVYTYDFYGGGAKCLQPNETVTVDGAAVGVGLFPTYHELGSSGLIRSAKLGCE